jgi:uncharacterized protein YciI
MKYVMFYGGMSAGHNVRALSEAEQKMTPEERMAQTMQVYPRHKARVDEFVAAGKIVAIGTFENPMANGSMGIFSSKEAVEEFMAGDPFMLEGLVRSWRLLEWNDSVLP